MITRKPFKLGLLVGTAIALLVWPSFCVHVNANSEPGIFGSPLKLKCKYSVRDVGFVDVHSFGWQLFLAKPAGVQPSEMETIEEAVRTALKKSNVHHLWVDRDSDEWNKHFDLLKKNDPLAKKCWGILTNVHDQHFALSIEDESESQALTVNEYSHQLSKLVDSPFRQKLVRSCSERLCTIVMVESDDRQANQTARVLLKDSIARLEKQMWELEKPTEKAAQGLVVEKSQIAGEEWFLKSFHGRSSAQPVFAIFYGQARRLGDPILLEDATVPKLTGRAAVCGGDCECELDRDWLYGHQFIHRWTSEMEQIAEGTLDFDPQSAFAKSEVAAIVRKPTRKGAGIKSIDLGPGLIIHDLEPIERKSMEKPSTKDGDVRKSGDTKANVESMDSDSNSLQIGENILESTDNLDNEGGIDDNRIRLPTTLFIGLALVAGITGIWFFSRRN